MPHVAYCLASGPTHAAALLGALHRAGWTDPDLSVLLVGTDPAGGPLAGVPGLRPCHLPGMGPLLAAGPIRVDLAGFGKGGLLGPLLMGLLGLGLPDGFARAYEGKLRTGSVILGAHADTPERLRDVRALFAHARGAEVTTGESARVPHVFLPVAPIPR